MSFVDLDQHIAECFAVGSSLCEARAINVALQSMGSFAHGGGLRGIQIIQRAQFCKPRKAHAKKSGPVAKEMKFMPVVRGLLGEGGSINSIAKQTGLNRCTVIRYKKLIQAVTR